MSRWNDLPRIEATVEGNTGSAKVAFIEDDGYNAPHWSAFISVPFQDSKWEYLGGSSLTKEDAIAKAMNALEYRLSRCRLI